MSAALDRIIETVRPRLVGVLDLAIKQELFSVVDEFLQGASCWTETIPFTVKVDATGYAISPSMGQIIELQEIKDPGDSPVGGVMPTPGQIELPDGSQAGRYKAVVSLSVIDPVDRSAYPQLPDWIVKKYHTVLVDGVMGHMTAQLSKPYTNETLSVYYLRRFRNGISTARVAALRKHTQGNQNWVFPQSFAVKRR